MRLLPVVNVVCKTKKGCSREGWDWPGTKADREAVVQGQVNGRYMAEYRVFRCTPKCFFASMWPCKLWWRLDVKTPRQARSDSASLTDFCVREGTSLRRVQGLFSPVRHCISGPIVSWCRASDDRFRRAAIQYFYVAQALVFLALTLAGLWPTPPFFGPSAAAGGDEPSASVTSQLSPTRHPTFESGN